ncbi:cation:proton antiporter family protein [Marinicella rhabdoformis]|uniref:cation:proton antiporter family protein n=1 Tax=Marinicella rhabdoformis TaxID=2580566 RepID=UPI0012AEC32D|nr:cation:proton antiporter family protein [Marinicella rhabdoformis]
MHFSSVAIAFSDVSWIAVAFLFGWTAKQIKLPPLVGFLLAGFVIQHFPHADAALFDKLSDIGITLLLFTIGLKINIKSLIKPHIWAVTSLHTALVVTVFFGLFKLLAWGGFSQLQDLSDNTLVIIAFALSFSSTVFVVKILEDKGEYQSRHGQIAIGVLVIQDIFAVVFLAFSTGKVPSIWALALLLLWPMRLLIARVLNKIGHGELLVLFGFFLALGGAQVFELVSLKGDLGALIVGMLLAPLKKSEELAKTMMAFKDLFLLGFFISIGLTGTLTWNSIWMAALLLILVAFKTGLFFWLFSRFSLRARTSVLASLNLSNYSEFGLIVAAIGVTNQWLTPEWLIIIAVAMSLSQITAALLNANAHQHFKVYRHFWLRFQKQIRLPDDQAVDISRAKVVIIGLGRVGCGAYDHMHEQLGDEVVGIDIDAEVVETELSKGRQAIVGDPSDADFWDRVLENHQLQMVMITLPNIKAALSVIEQLKTLHYDGQIAATSRYFDHEEIYKAAGVDTVFNVYTQAGSGFASQVLKMT